MSLSTRTKVKPPSSVSVTWSEVTTGTLVAEVGWTPVASAWPSSYYVLYKDGVELATSLTATTYRDTAVLPGQDPLYEVSTVNVNAVEGDVRGASVAIPVYPVWESGWSVQLEQNATQNIAVRATDPAGGTLTFSRNGGTAPAQVTVSSAGILAAGVAAAGSYTTIVRASNGQLASDYTLSTAITSPIAAPGTPTNFAVVAQSSSSIAGSFQQGTGGAPASYDVARSLTGNNAQTPTASGWTSISLSTALATSFTNTGLSSSTQYFYRVRARNAGGDSAYATDSATTQGTSGTTFTIPTGTSDYNATNVSGGDTIVIARGSGTRGPLVIRNAIGTAGNRIRIVGDPAGLVTIRRSSTGSSGFILQFINCHHVDIDFENTGVSGVGAANHCGVKLTYASNASTTNKESVNAFFKLFGIVGQANSVTDNFTLRYLWIDGGWSATANDSLLSNGIGLAGNHKQSSPKGGDRWQENILIEYCFIQNVEGEGIYLGPNYNDGSVPLRNIEISHVTVDNTGQDGINGKSWWEGTNSIHHCVVTNAGRVVASQGALSGIAMMGCTGSAYNNVVSGSGGPGIRFGIDDGPNRNVAETSYGTFNTFDCVAYNNVSTDNGRNTSPPGHGIHLTNQSSARTQLVPFLYSNTLADNRQTGITVENNGAGGGRVQNNIALGNATQISVGPASTTESGNLTSGITSANCFTADYHLTAAGETAALGCVGTRGTNYSTTDLDGATRPATAANAHVGAYET